MTVCVAAIFSKPGLGVVCASDRMLTAGNIQFQPPTPKVWPLTRSIYMLVAGNDMTLQYEIYQEVNKTVRDRVDAEPKNWWRVRDVANLYSHHYADWRRRRSEYAILSPLGLTHATFLQKQSSMDSTLVNDIALRLSNFEMPATQTIIAGVDESGAHLYVVNDGNVSCNDMMGFAAVGSGYWHANSHFMLSGYNPTSTGERAILITHQAKKKSEVAPGVGKDTDMILIGPGLGILVEFRSDVVADWDKQYDEYMKQTGELNALAEKKMTDYINTKLATPNKNQGVAEKIDEKKKT
jgi:20S proteasome alpha/beta subunit